MRSLWLLALVWSCGGKLDTGDAGPGADGGPGGKDAMNSIDDGVQDVGQNVDVTIQPTCLMGIGGGTVGSDGSCTSTQSYSCGPSDYEISCSCPQATCQCIVDNQVTFSMAPPSGVCPTCSVTTNIDKLAALCSFPQP
jgi:hypothetical protein